MTDLRAAGLSPDAEEAGGTIIVERHIPAAPDVVYAYLTEADKWIRWQGIAAELEPRPGGSFLMSMPGGPRASGRFLELVPGVRVVFTWGWVDHPGVPPGSSTVRMDLTPDAGGTLVRLTHAGLPSSEVDVHARGWLRYLPRLAVAATGATPEPDPGPS